MEHLPLPLCLSFICINALRYVCINTCVCLYICIYVRVYKSICMYTCPCTHTKSGQISISFSSLQQSWISPHIFICLVHICCPLASWFSLSSFSTLPLTLSFQKKNKFSLPLLKILFILQTVFFSLVVLVYKQVLKKLFNIFLLGKKKKRKKKSMLFWIGGKSCMCTMGACISTVSTCVAVWHPLPYEEEFWCWQFIFGPLHLILWTQSLGFAIFKLLCFPFSPSSDRLSSPGAPPCRGRQS